MSRLIETYRGTVYPWQCDHMDHMNVMWYVGKFDEATWNFFARFGLTPSYFKQNGRGMAALDQRVVYKRELHAGEIVSIHSGLLEIKEKVLRFIHEMRNEENHEVSAITLLTGVHLDTGTRKSCLFPEDVVRQAREWTVQYEIQ